MRVKQTRVGSEARSEPESDPMKTNQIRGRARAIPEPESKPEMWQNRARFKAEAKSDPRPIETEPEPNVSNTWARAKRRISDETN